MGGIQRAGDLLHDRDRAIDLGEVEVDPRVSSVDFFRWLSKTEENSAIGATLIPNFCYRNLERRAGDAGPVR